MGGNADEIGLGLVEAFKIAVGFVEGPIGLPQFGVELDQVFDETRVFERNRRLVRERGEGDEVFLRITVAADLCAQSEQADPFAFRDNGELHFRFEVIEPLPFGGRNRPKCREQVEVVLQKRFGILG